MPKNIFTHIRLSKPKRSVFDLSHDLKTTMDMGQLVPTMCIDCVPGDSFTIGCESLLRFPPLLAPVMHRFDIYNHYYFVPKRLLWDNWDKWIMGESVNPVPAAHPYFNLNAADGNWNITMDYMGIPDPGESVGSETEKINVLPLSAYQFICNEYYRDQNLSTPFLYKVTDGDNTGDIGQLSLLRLRAWEHDYFTSALPFAQKGPGVSIPISGFNNVELIADDVAGGAVSSTVSGIQQPGSIAVGWNVQTLDDGSGKIYAKTEDLNAVDSTISDLRRAYALQRFFEKAARGGTRLKEWIWHMFGVNTGDARLDRPEYITGTKSPVIISEVLNTTGEIDGLPQGNMAGHGAAVVSGKYGKYFVKEHGFIMCITSVMPRTAYQQGLEKMWLKINNAYEHFYTDFENIGEQEIKRREVMAYTANGDEPFGYIPRYAEYKFQNSRVAGSFRNSLSYWHAGRIFTGEPALNEAFIECDATKRIFAVDTPGVQNLYCQILHRIKAVRPMQKWGNPY